MAASRFHHLIVSVLLLIYLGGVACGSQQLRSFPLSGTQIAYSGSLMMPFQGTTSHAPVGKTSESLSVSATGGSISHIHLLQVHLYITLEMLHDRALLARRHNDSGKVVTCISPIFPSRTADVYAGRIPESEAEREGSHGDVETQGQARHGR